MTRRESTSRETIPIGSGRSVQIIVVRLSTQGADMGNHRGGQMLKELVPRQPNGQPRRPTLKQMKAIEAEKRLGELATVLRQPHRREFGNSPWAATALGRLCLRTKCREELYHAADAYLTLKRRWGAAMQTPRGFDNADAVTSRFGDGPAASTVKEWLRQIIACEIAMGRKNNARFVMLHDLIVFDREYDSINDPVLIAGLRELAVSLSIMKESEHPFLGGR